MSTIKGEYQDVKQELKEIIDGFNLHHEDKQEVLMMFHHVFTISYMIWPPQVEQWRES